MSNHEADIENANKGIVGVNATFAKAQGNKGKLLNPNQKSSLIILFDAEKEFYHPPSNERMFMGDYLDKGIAEDIKGRLISNEELKHRAILCYCASYFDDGDENRFLYFDNDYICIEFLRDKNNPWTLEDANQLLKDRINKIIYECYFDYVYIDGKWMENYVAKRESDYIDAMEGMESVYLHAIDGTSSY